MTIEAVMGTDPLVAGVARAHTPTGSTLEPIRCRLCHGMGKFPVSIIRAKAGELPHTCGQCAGLGMVWRLI